MSKKQIVQSTVDIVKAYVAGNKVPVEKLPRLVNIVLDALSELDRSTGKGAGKTSTPAVAIRKSVNRNRIVCLEDGKKFKSLKGHLRAAHGLTPDEYRAKWGLEDRYPMVAPLYSAWRSQMAVNMGLGRYVRRRSASRKTGEKHLSDVA
jgi:predicted transcriptional regulator